MPPTRWKTPAPWIGSLNIEPPLPEYCSSAPEATLIGVVALAPKTPLPMRSAPALTVTLPPVPKLAPLLPEMSSSPVPALTSEPVPVPVIVAGSVEFRLLLSPTVSVTPLAILTALLLPSALRALMVLLAFTVRMALDGLLFTFESQTVVPPPVV